MDLSWNNIGNQSGVALAKALETNNTLTNLYVYNNKIDEKILTRLYYLININRPIKYLNIKDTPLTSSMIKDLKKSDDFEFRLDRKLLKQATVEELVKSSVINKSILEYSDLDEKSKKSKINYANKLVAIELMEKLSDTDNIPSFEDLYSVVNNYKKQHSALDILAENITPLEFQKFQNKMIQIYKLTPEKIEQMPNTHFKKSLKKHFEKQAHLKKMREQGAGRK